MKSPLLILDVPFLAHRSVAAMGGLSHEGSSTDVVFGLLRDLVVWQGMFRTTRVAFCFDFGRNKRLEVSPEYKGNRSHEELTEEERMRRASVREQADRLREEELYRIGFRNVFWREGYEADDVIASVAMDLPEKEEAIVVASDADLYQLISGNVSIYNPTKNKQLTLQQFHSRYGILSSQWADVKAICGCPGDNVRGVQGVGEKTAILFLRGELKPEKKRYRAIVENRDLWQRNLRLVQLPFEGVGRFELREDKVTEEKWRRFCKEKGIRSLKGVFA